MTRTECFSTWADKLGVKVHRISNPKESRSDTSPLHPALWVASDRIEETVVFWPAMHELGHVATRSVQISIDHLGEQENDGSCDAYILETEAGASKWALEIGAPDFVDADAYRCLALGLETYLEGFRETFGAKGAESYVAFSWAIEGVPHGPFPVKGVPGVTVERDPHYACTMPADVLQLYNDWTAKGAASKLTPKDCVLT